MSNSNRRDRLGLMEEDIQRTRWQRAGQIGRDNPLLIYRKDTEDAYARKYIQPIATSLRTRPID